MKELNVKRLEVEQIERKLNNILGLDESETGSAFLTMLTLTKPSPKHKMPANSPFPAVVKKAKDGRLAVFSSVLAKTEIIPECSFREPTPIGQSFEYAGHVYKRNPAFNLYECRKKPVV